MFYMPKGVKFNFTYVNPSGVSYSLVIDFANMNDGSLFTFIRFKTDNPKPNESRLAVQGANSLYGITYDSFAEASVVNKTIMYKYIKEFSEYYI